MQSIGPPRTGDEPMMKRGLMRGTILGLEGPPGGRGGGMSLGCLNWGSHVCSHISFSLRVLSFRVPTSVCAQTTSQSNRPRDQR